MFKDIVAGMDSLIFQLARRERQVGHDTRHTHAHAYIYTYTHPIHSLLTLRTSVPRFSCRSRSFEARRRISPRSWPP